MPNQGGRQEEQRAGQPGHEKDDGRNTKQKASDQKQDRGGQRGGSGNFAEDRDRPSEAGGKGGQH